jgi:hypothetical protein
MQPTRVGAIASFVLTGQFLLTLLWIVVAWPAGGLAGLADAMAEYFRARATEPLPFAVLNLYNVSFALSALTLGVVLRRQFSDFPYRADFAFFSIVIAAAMYVASGVVPLVAAPDLVKTGDLSAVNAIEGVGAGLLLGGTMASGFAVTVFALIGFSSKRLPFPLCVLMLTAGLVEVVEWAVPAILVLDPLLGAFWSIWLGILLWTNHVAPSEPARQRLMAGEEAIT